MAQNGVQALSNGTAIQITLNPEQKNEGRLPHCQELIDCIDQWAMLRDELKKISETKSTDIVEVKNEAAKTSSEQKDLVYVKIEAPLLDVKRLETQIKIIQQKIIEILANIDKKVADLLEEQKGLLHPEYFSVTPNPGDTRDGTDTREKYKGLTPLVVAASKGLSQAVKMISENAVDVDKICFHKESGVTALLAAVQSGDIDTITDLCQKVQDPVQVLGIFSTAVTIGNVNIVTLLLNKYSEIIKYNAPDLLTKKFHQLLTSGDPDPKMVCCLVQFGVNLTQYIDHDRRRPLAYVLTSDFNKKYELIKSLFAGEVKPDLEHAFYRRVTRLATENLCYLTPLLYAVKNNLDLKIIKFFVAENANLEACIRYESSPYKEQHPGLTALHLAVCTPWLPNDRLKLVKILLNIKEDEKSISSLPKSESPELIEKRKKLINLQNKGQTPLWLAVKDNRFQVAILLAQYGGDPNITPEKEESAIKMAIQKNNKVLIKALCQAGAKINQDRMDDLLKTIKEEDQFLDLLTDMCTARPIKSKSEEKTDEKISAAKKSKDENTEWVEVLQSVLLKAVDNSWSNVIKYLNSLNDFRLAGQRSAFRAVFFQETINLEILRTFRDETSETKKYLYVDEVLLINAEKQCTPLTYVIETIKEEKLCHALVTELLEGGANASLPRNEKDAETPLHLAVVRGDLELVKLLLKYKANVDAVDKEGRSPLLRAMHPIVQMDMVKLLVENKASVTVEDKNGNTPALLAIGNTELFDYLKSKGANFKVIAKDKPSFFQVLLNQFTQGESKDNEDDKFNKFATIAKALIAVTDFNQKPVGNNSAKSLLRFFLDKIESNFKLKQAHGLLLLILKEKNSMLTQETCHEYLEFCVVNFNADQLQPILQYVDNKPLLEKIRNDLLQKNVSGKRIERINDRINLLARRDQLEENGTKFLVRETAKTLKETKSADAKSTPPLRTLITGVKVPGFETIPNFDRTYRQLPRKLSETHVAEAKVITQFVNTLTSDNLKKCNQDLLIDLLLMVVKVETTPKLTTNNSEAAFKAIRKFIESVFTSYDKTLGKDSPLLLAKILLLVIQADSDPWCKEVTSESLGIIRKVNAWECLLLPCDENGKSVLYHWVRGNLPNRIELLLKPFLPELLKAPKTILEALELKDSGISPYISKEFLSIEKLQQRETTILDIYLYCQKIKLIGINAAGGKDPQTLTAEREAALLKIVSCFVGDNPDNGLRKFDGDKWIVPVYMRIEVFIKLTEGTTFCEKLKGLMIPNPTDNSANRVNASANAAESKTISQENSAAPDLTPEEQLNQRWSSQCHMLLEFLNDKDKKIESDFLAKVTALRKKEAEFEAKPDAEKLAIENPDKLANQALVVTAGKQGIGGLTPSSSSLLPGKDDKFLSKLRLLQN